MKSKHNAIHKPKKVVYPKRIKVFSRSFTLSAANANYKTQNKALRENNSDLAKQLSILQTKFKESEQKVGSLQRALNGNIQGVIMGNLNKMANHLKIFLGTLQQTRQYCNNPETTDMELTVLNPDLDIISPSQKGLSKDASSQNKFSSPRAKRHSTTSNANHSSDFNGGHGQSSASSSNSIHSDADITIQTNSRRASSINVNKGKQTITESNNDTVTVERSFTLHSVTRTTQTTRSLPDCSIELERLPLVVCDPADNNSNIDLEDTSSDSPANKSSKETPSRQNRNLRKRQPPIVSPRKATLRHINETPQNLVQHNGSLANSILDAGSKRRSFHKPSSPANYLDSDSEVEELVSSDDDHEISPNPKRVTFGHATPIRNGSRRTCAQNRRSYTEEVSESSSEDDMVEVTPRGTKNMGSDSRKVKHRKVGKNEATKGSKKKQVTGADSRKIISSSSDSKTRKSVRKQVILKIVDNGNSQLQKTNVIKVSTSVENKVTKKKDSKSSPGKPKQHKQQQASPKQEPRLSKRLRR